MKPPRHARTLAHACAAACALGWVAASWAPAQVALGDNMDTLGSAPAAQAVPPDHAEKMARSMELFKTQVRAILEHNCLQCHGGAEVRGELDLATREGLLKGGIHGPAVLVGDAQRSLLYQLIAHAAEPHMPYEAAQLPQEAIRHVAHWIDLGAAYDRPLVDEAETLSTQVPEAARSWWAFQPLQRPEPPSVAGIDQSGWCRTPVDRFIATRLAAHGLHANQLADKRTLIRRATLDLTGLPPTPEEVEAFLNDTAADAYERLIDRLLASPHYGERWARHWLDLARYAESHGYEQDYDRTSAYHYRDFVIQALNSDLPYDRFVQWQIAGDELDPENPLALMATGFLAAGTHATQITANQAEKERYDELDDMAATIGTAMLGLTIGCARCHDHKYDPIPTYDYYRLVSTFTTTVRSEIDLDLDPEETRRRQQQHAARLAVLAQRLARYEAEELPARFEQWLATNPAEPNPRWLVLEADALSSSGGASFALQPDGSYLAAGPNAASDEYTLTAVTPLGRLTALRIEALADPSLPRGGPGRAENGNFALSEVRLEAIPLHTSGEAAGALRSEGVASDAAAAPATQDAPAATEAGTPSRQDAAPAPENATPPNEAPTRGKNNDPPATPPPASSTASVPPEVHRVRLTLRNPVASFEQAGLPVTAVLDEDASSAWAIDPQVGQNHQAVFAVEGLPAAAAGVRLALTLKFSCNAGHNLGRLRVSISTQAFSAELGGDEAPHDLAVAAAAALRVPAGERTTEHQAALVQWYRRLDPEWQELHRAVEQHRQQAPQPQTVKALITSEGLPAVRLHTQGPDFYEQTYFLKRGDLTQKLAEARQGFLQVLVRAPEGERRWQQPPPPGWRTSYRRRAMAAWITDIDQGAGALLARVIVNRLWQHHFGRGIVATPSDFGAQGEPPTHPELLEWLAAELVSQGWRLKPMHKLIMTSSVYMQSAAYDDCRAAIDPDNRLCWRRPVRRLEAEVIRDGMLAASGRLERRMFGPGSLDEGQPRRSIYYFIKRSQLIPLMVLFDVPEPLVGQAQRPATVVAPQALALMNNPHVRAWAAHFARRVDPGMGGSWDEAIAAAYRLALTREPTEGELARCRAFCEAQGEHYRRAGHAEPRRLALTDFCQSLFCLNEFMYVD